MLYSTDYSTLLDLIIQLIQSQTGKKIGSGQVRLNDAQTLSLKLFRHLVSMQSLAEGATIERNNTPRIFFIDHGSVKVVARAALETYLVFFFLYGGADKAVSQFRHKTWRLGGLMDRQKLHASTPKTQQVLVKERLLIQALQSEVKVSPHFQTYSKKQGLKLLEGDWRNGLSWSALGVKAGFPEQYFEDIYGYLCGYSHSSYLSALQVGQAKSIEDQHMLTKAILNVGVAIMAHFAFSYSNVFSSASSVLEASSEAKCVAERWCFKPENIVP